jgi:hypothetical protein
MLGTVPLAVRAMERWVRSRDDMRYVNVVDLNAYRPPRGTAHYHIYVTGPLHPALSLTV